MKDKKITYIVISVIAVIFISIVAIRYSNISKQLKYLTQENLELREHQSCTLHNKEISDLKDSILDLENTLDNKQIIKDEISNAVTTFLRTYFDNSITENEKEKREKIKEMVDTKTYNNLYPLNTWEEYNEGIDYKTSINVKETFIDIEGDRAKAFVISEYSNTIFENTSISSHIFNCSLIKTGDNWIIDNISINNFIKLL